MMVSKFTCNNSSKVAPAARNGPKGMTLSFFFHKMIKAIGRPISEPINIDSIAIG